MTNNKNGKAMEIDWNRVHKLDEAWDNIRSIMCEDLRKGNYYLLDGIPTPGDSNPHWHFLRLRSFDFTAVRMATDARVWVTEIRGKKELAYSGTLLTLMLIYLCGEEGERIKDDILLKILEKEQGEK